MAPRGRAEPEANTEIANLLRSIRDDAGITAAGKAGELIGVSQSTISRWEKGVMVPSPDDAERYARALKAPAAQRRQLIAMARDLHEQHRATAPARVRVSRAASHEKRVLRNEQRAKRISWFHPLLMPGALQTADYIRAVMSSGTLTPAQIEERVSARLQRVQVIRDESRHYTFILTAGSLGWRFGTPDMMVRQIERLIEASQWPNISLGVIHWGTQVTVFPSCGFDLYDDHTAVVGVVGGTAYYNDPKDVKGYVAMFERLKLLAVWGDAARTELRRVADEYRALL